MRPIVPAAAAAALLLAGQAGAQTIDVPAGTYVNDPTHTNVLWKLSHFGLSTYIGRFDEIDATIELDPDSPADSTMTATIAADSVDVNYPRDDVDFAAEIASEKFLDAANHPDITFESTAIEITGDDTATITGDLTLHGQTREETMDVTFNDALNPHPMTEQPALGFSGTMTIDRTQYGIDTFAGPVGAEVTLEIEAEFAPQGS